MIKKISKYLLQIQDEPILKRRQSLFKRMLSSCDANTVQLIISFSLVVKYSVNFSIKHNLAKHEESLEDFFGSMLYYIDVDDKRKLVNYLKSLPEAYQVVAKWVLSNKFARALTLDFILENVPKIYTLPEIKDSYVTIFCSDPKQPLKDIVREAGLDFPMYYIKVAKVISKKYKTFYYTKDGHIIHTNVYNKKLKDFLDNTYEHKKYFGVIGIYSVINKKPHVQIIATADSPFKITGLYSGRLTTDIDKLIKINAITKPSRSVVVHANNYIKLNSISDIGTAPKWFLTNPTVLTMRGIRKLPLTHTSKYYKIVDYLLDNNYNPIGYKVDVDGAIVEIEREVPKSVLIDGIENRYAKVTTSYYKDTLVGYYIKSVANTNYKQCTSCGNIRYLKKNGLCWECNKLMFRKAVELGGSKYFKLPVMSDNVTAKFSVYKFDVTINNGEAVFEENLDNWKGKELYLPYDWWA